MFFKGKHEAARMELRFINKTGNRHFDKPSYIYMYIYICIYMYIQSIHIGMILPVVPHKAVAEVSKIGNL